MLDIRIRLTTQEKLLDKSKGALIAMFAKSDCITGLFLCRGDIKEPAAMNIYLISL